MNFPFFGSRTPSHSDKTAAGRADFLLSDHFQKAGRAEIHAAIVKEIVEAERLAVEKALSDSKVVAISKLREVVVDLSARGLTVSAEEAARRLREMED